MPVIGLVDKAHFKIQTKMKLLGILFLLCVLTMPVVAQDHCRIMFYNVENLFDTADDRSTEIKNCLVSSVWRKWKIAGYWKI